MPVHRHSDYDEAALQAELLEQSDSEVVANYWGFDPYYEDDESPAPFLRDRLTGLDDGE